MKWKVTITYEELAEIVVEAKSKEEAEEIAISTNGRNKFIDRVQVSHSGGEITSISQKSSKFDAWDIEPITKKEVEEDY